MVETQLNIGKMIIFLVTLNQIALESLEPGQNMTGAMVWK